MVSPARVTAWLAAWLLGVCAAGGTLAARTASQPRGAITFGGGDGRSCDAAIVIAGARDTGAGVKAQRRWIAEHLPGARRTGSALARRHGRVYEVVSLTGAGAPSVCFDVSGFFGSW
ncbi:hypothetical protein [Methylobacterium trifolii]|uniref:Uncharacterized protein n=1 Tax=Methylobacterium trifolii TaxID=1003092 RepID=A0ABQ4U1H3_9HYPH|nr:hypothetical protein [Methylobacterium trifolii]GJE60679.1 hypothetical protein MPOCJGCO_2793 [Methylobacterium trifolii]